MVRRLATTYMTDEQLWRRARGLTAQARPLINRGGQDLDLTLDQLEAVLDELHLRGQQLALFPGSNGPGQLESPRRIGH